MFQFIINCQQNKIVLEFLTQSNSHRIDSMQLYKIYLELFEDHPDLLMEFNNFKPSIKVIFLF